MEILNFTNGRKPSRQHDREVHILQGSIARHSATRGPLLTSKETEPLIRQTRKKRGWPYVSREPIGLGGLIRLETQPVAVVRESTSIVVDLALQSIGRRHVVDRTQALSLGQIIRIL